MLSRVAHQSSPADLSVNASLPGLIRDAKSKEVLDILTPSPELLDQLEFVDFMRLLFLLHIAGDPRADEVFPRLLAHDLMGRVQDFNPLLIDYHPIPHAIGPEGASLEVLQARTNAFLATPHAERIPPAHLNILFVSYKKRDADTARLEALMGPESVAQIPPSLYEKRSRSWFPCNLV